MTSSVSSQPLVAKLTSLGDCRTQGEDSLVWDKYITELHLGNDDVPGLIEIAVDEELNSLPIEQIEASAAIYARRILGKMGAIAAIEPLMALFSTQADNDWVSEELPKIYGMIGKSAIPPLQNFLGDNSQQVFPRLSAINSLEEITHYYPDQKTSVIQVLGKQLKHFKENPPELNAFIIASSVNLQANQLGYLIKLAFDNNFVDTEVVEDWESVRKLLGISSDEKLQLWEEIEAPEVAVISEISPPMIETVETTTEVDLETETVSAEVIEIPEVTQSEVVESEPEVEVEPEIETFSSVVIETPEPTQSEVVESELEPEPEVEPEIETVSSVVIETPEVTQSEVLEPEPEIETVSSTVIETPEVSQSKVVESELEPEPEVEPEIETVSSEVVETPEPTPSETVESEPEVEPEPEIETVSSVVVEIPEVTQSEVVESEPEPEVETLINSQTIIETSSETVINEEEVKTEDAIAPVSLAQESVEEIAEKIEVNQTEKKIVESVETLTPIEKAEQIEPKAETPTISTDESTTTESQSAPVINSTPKTAKGFGNTTTPKKPGKKKKK